VNLASPAAFHPTQLLASCVLLVHTHPLLIQPNAVIASKELIRRLLAPSNAHRVAQALLPLNKVQPNAWLVMQAPQHQTTAPLLASPVMPVNLLILLCLAKAASPERHLNLALLNLALIAHLVDICRLAVKLLALIVPLGGLATRLEPCNATHAPQERLKRILDKTIASAAIREHSMIVQD
jgi:hypothetical protein